eukprot:5148615-Pleurochrysis_carterae.AAC.2
MSSIFGRYHFLADASTGSGPPHLPLCRRYTSQLVDLCTSETSVCLRAVQPLSSVVDCRRFLSNASAECGPFLSPPCR